MFFLLDGLKCLGGKFFLGQSSSDGSGGLSAKIQGFEFFVVVELAQSFLLRLVHDCQNARNALANFTAVGEKNLTHCNVAMNFWKIISREKRFFEEMGYKSKVRV